MRSFISLLLGLLTLAVLGQAQAQTLSMRAQQLMVSPAQIPSTKCIQVGLFFTVTGAGNNQDWAQITMNLDYSLSGGAVLSSSPVAQLSDFVGTDNSAEPGITNPGTPLDSSPCLAADVINSATQGDSGSSFIANAANPSSAGGAAFVTESVNTGAQSITLNALNLAPDLFQTDDGTEYLAAIVSFPVDASSASGSSIGIDFASGTGQNLITDGTTTLDANGNTTDGAIALFEPLACSGATAADNQGTASGSSIAINYVDPQVGGNGGDITFTMPHAAQDPDRIVVTSDDAGSITLAGGQIGPGSTTLSLNTANDGTPSTGAAVNYMIAYQTEFPAGSGNYVGGDACMVTVNWNAGSCDVAFDGSAETGQSTNVDVTATNIVYDNGNSRFASLATPQTSVDLTAPSGVSGNELTFDDAVSINPVGAGDYGSYSVSGATSAGGDPVACSNELNDPAPPPTPTPTPTPEPEDAEPVPAATPWITALFSLLMVVTGLLTVRRRRMP